MDSVYTSVYGTKNSKACKNIIAITANKSSFRQVFAKAGRFERHYF